ncbi:unnamed protein product [Lathyrus oleraceus]
MLLFPIAMHQVSPIHAPEAPHSLVVPEAPLPSPIADAAESMLPPEGP